MTEPTDCKHILKIDHGPDGKDFRIVGCQLCDIERGPLIVHMTKKLRMDGVMSSATRFILPGSVDENGAPTPWKCRELMWHLVMRREVMIERHAPVEEHWAKHLLMHPATWEDFEIDRDDHGLVRIEYGQRLGQPAQPYFSDIPVTRQPGVENGAILVVWSA